MARELIRRKGESEMLPSHVESLSIGSLWRDMNRLFEDFTRGWPRMEMAPEMGAFVPYIDVTETDDGVHVEAELPGLTEKDIELTLSPEGDALTIKGEKKVEREQRGRGVYRAERAWGSFVRTLDLPSPVIQDKVDAKFKNGVLTVKMDKSPEAKKAQRKIPVKAD